MHKKSELNTYKENIGESLLKVVKRKICKQQGNGKPEEDIGKRIRMIGNVQANFSSINVHIHENTLFSLQHLTLDEPHQHFIINIKNCSSECCHSY